MNQQAKYVVFFDLDNTLLSVNSGKVIVKVAFKSGLMPFFSLIKGIILSILHKINLGNQTRIIESMTLWLKGFSTQQIEDFVNLIVDEKLIPNIRPSIIQEIKRHRSNNAEIVILSAAPDFICEPLAQHLDINYVISTKLEIFQGNYTGKVSGKICIDKQKVVRLKEFCSEKQFTLQDAFYYGDNHTDKYALETVGHPVCVSPDKKLRKLAILKSWQIIE
ncbi:MAG: hypothetical protein AUJ98_01775 [Bacteroidetes bacterium CG2_30_33_31]|nr:MAG: hypothetical protein AUJ98_01775 [Bacteroidetes bacterium CG2_30_33_31]